MNIAECLKTVGWHIEGLPRPTLRNWEAAHISDYRVSIDRYFVAISNHGREVVYGLISPSSRATMVPLLTTYGTSPRWVNLFASCNYRFLVGKKHPEPVIPALRKLSLHFRIAEDRDGVRCWPTGGGVLGIRLGLNVHSKTMPIVQRDHRPTALRAYMQARSLEQGRNIEIYPIPFKQILSLFSRST